MRRQILFTLAFIIALLAAPAAAVSITDSSVSNTNIYASSSTFNIGPAAEIDESSTASGVTAVSGRYVYASSLTNTVAAGLATYTINGLQGATVVEATQGTTLGMDWTYGDGSTATTDSLTHIFNTPGTYTTTLELSNYLTTSDITLSTSVVLASSGVSDCSVSNTNIYAGSNSVQITPSAYDKGGNTATDMTSVSGRYVYAGDVSSNVEGATASLATSGTQGSSTISATQGTAQSWLWNFGDEQTTDTVGDVSHTYTAAGEYAATLTLTNYLDQTGSTSETTLSIWPIAPSITASASVVPQGGTTTLTAEGDLWNTIQWQYSTNEGTSWQDISGATTSPYDWQPAVGTYSVRAHVFATSTGFSVDSDSVTISVYAPPTINAVAVSPTIGQYTQTITLSAEVTDSGPAATTYQWQQSPEGQNTWTNTPGATTAQWIGQLTVSGATDFRLIAVGTGGQTISDTVTYYVAAPGEIQSLTATPSVVALPGSTTLTATGSNILSWEWQEYTNGVWTPIGYSVSLRESLTTEGTYEYRVLATGVDGTTITSETVEVLAGYAPTVSITSPANNAELPAGNSVTAQATITGTDVVYEWNLGAGGVGNLNTNPTTITYTSQGYKTITITAESIFGTATDSVTILYGKAPRPMQTELFDEVDTTPVANFVNQFAVQPGEMPNPVGIVASLFAPFDDALKGFFWVLMFGAVMLVVWLISKNIAIPSVLGILFGSFMIGFMPDMYLYPAVALIAAGCAGGLVYVVRKN